MQHFKHEIQHLRDVVLGDSNPFPMLHIPERSSGIQTWIKPQEIEFLVRKHLQQYLFNNNILTIDVRGIKDVDDKTAYYAFMQGAEVIATLRHDSTKIKIVETPFTGDTVYVDESHWLADEQDFLYNEDRYYKLCNDFNIYGYQRYREVFNEEYNKVATASCHLQIFPVVDEDRLAGLTVLIKEDDDVLYYKLFK